MEKGYKYRIYPTEEQKKIILLIISACRYVYNKTLEWHNKVYESENRYVSYREAWDMLVNAFVYFDWLNEADHVALQQTLMNLEQAFKNFFNKKSRYPKFKSKRKSRLSYRTMNNNNTLKIIGDKIHIPKVGDVKAVISRTAPEGWKIKSATISMERDGTFYVSLLYSNSKEKEPPVTTIVDPKNTIGLDYKSDGLYVDDNGTNFHMEKCFRKSEPRLRREQRKLARMIRCHITGFKKGNRGGDIPIYDKPLKDCKNIQKQIKKIAKIHRHIADQRKDTLHKESTRIANLYDLVAVEDLDFKAMSNKGFGNGKATLDNGGGMFYTFLEYKLRERGKPFIKVDKWYPSSQLCSCCGHRDKRLKNLQISRWECPECGAVHNRDHNAAKNIKTEGLRIFSELLTKAA